MNEEGLEPLPAEKRQLMGWWILGVLFLLMAGLTVASTFVKSEKTNPADKDYTGVVQSLKLGMISKVVGSMSQDDNLKELITEVRADAKTNITAAKILLVLDQETSTTLNPDALDLLAKQTRAKDQAFATLYSPRSSKDEVNAALPKVEPTSFVERAARFHAKKRLGEKNPDSELGARGELAKLGLVALFFVAIVLLCPGAWIFFVLAKNSGSLKPQPSPLGELTFLQADGLAMRAVQIVGLFVLGQPLLSYVANKLIPVPGIAALLSMAGFVAGLLWIIKLPLNGETLSLVKIGYGKGDLGKHLLWGAGAFIAELPVGLFIALGSTQLLKFLPPAQHDAVDVLQKSTSLPMIFATLVLGVLFAAFWEEILFRGILFPALSKVMGGHWVGALVSSFMFASIHPQGIILWAPLAWMAGVSCLVARYSGSLVPSFVLHMLHNLTLMTVTLLMR